MGKPKRFALMTVLLVLTVSIVVPQAIASNPYGYDPPVDPDGWIINKDTPSDLYVTRRGLTFILECDLTFGGDGVKIADDGITLDLNGHRIIGQPGTRGIILEGVTGVTITNFGTFRKERTVYGGIDSFEYGIFLSDSHGNVVRGVRVWGNTYGIWLEDSSDNYIHQNTLESNSDTGIYLDNSDDNGVYPPRAPPKATPGGIVSNRIFGSDWGIWLEDSNWNVIRANHIHDNDWGIGLHESSNNVISPNMFRDNTLGDIRFF